MTQVCFFVFKNPDVFSLNNCLIVIMLVFWSCLKFKFFPKILVFEFYFSFFYFDYVFIIYIREDSFKIILYDNICDEFIRFLNEHSFFLLLYDLTSIEILDSINILNLVYVFVCISLNLNIMYQCFYIY